LEEETALFVHAFAGLNKNKEFYNFCVLLSIIVSQFSIFNRENL
jgi:hypothetical protein